MSLWNLTQDKLQQGRGAALVVKGGTSPPASPCARGEAPGNPAPAVDDSSDAVLAIDAAADVAATSPALEQPSVVPTLEQRTAGGSFVAGANTASIAANTASRAEAADVEVPAGSDLRAKSQAEQQQEGGDREWAAGDADEDMDDEATLDEDEV